MEIKKKNQIVFISEMRNPLTNASSTQIMTRNILYGFASLSENIIFVPILDHMEDADSIKHYYGGLCKKIIAAKAVTKFKTDRLLSKISMVWRLIIKTKVPDNVVSEIDPKAIIVAHSPSIDAALICNQIKRIRPDVNYIQYWGDPLALSLITPEQYSIRRSVQKLVEKRLHRAPDRIVYGTKSLYDAQITLFPEIKDKTFPVEVSYNPEEKDAPEEGHERLRIGYFGNYYSNIRNIRPFYEAACECIDADFVICGSSDVELESKGHVQIKKRISQSEVADEEAKLDVVICLLNRVGIQVPGKIFYQTNTKKTILIITDGPRENEIVEELKPSGRFIFCENNKRSIKEALDRIIAGEISSQGWNISMYTPENVCRKMIGVIGK